MSWPGPSAAGATSPRDHSANPRVSTSTANQWIRLTWMIHDVSVWRIDGIYITRSDGIWVNTLIDQGAAISAISPAAGTVPSNDAALLAALKSSGIPCRPMRLPRVIRLRRPRPQRRPLLSRPVVPTRRRLRHGLLPLWLCWRGLCWAQPG